jgi:hypothetical protein
LPFGVAGEAARGDSDEASDEGAAGGAGDFDAAAFDAADLDAGAGFGFVAHPASAMASASAARHSGPNPTSRAVLRWQRRSSEVKGRSRRMASTLCGARPLELSCTLHAPLFVFNSKRLFLRCEANTYML